jgi:hypothetical protein
MGYERLRAELEALAVRPHRTGASFLSPLRRKGMGLAMETICTFFLNYEQYIILLREGAPHGPRRQYAKSRHPGSRRLSELLGAGGNTPLEIIPLSLC